MIMDSSIPVDDPDGHKLWWISRHITSRDTLVHSARGPFPQGLENVSHGCISLSHEDAKVWYYNAVDIGDGR